MTDPMVSTDWLASRLQDPDVQVIDATWYMPGENRPGRAEFEAGHIPGAVFFDIDALSDPTSGLPHMLMSPETFAAAAGALGLRREATQIIYDGQGIFSAPRVWWTLKVMGFERVFVLDGGLVKWKVEGREIATGPDAPVATVVASGFDPDLVRNVAEVREALDDGHTQLIDARPPGRFTGEVPEPRAGLRGGHMPGARNLVWSAVVTPEKTLRSADELTLAFEEAGVDLFRPVITTCGSGVTASVLALALTRLGYAGVPVYDGSWSEWGSLADTPVVTGPAT